MITQNDLKEYKDKLHKASLELSHLSTAFYITGQEDTSRKINECILDINDSFKGIEQVINNDLEKQQQKLKQENKKNDLCVICRCETCIC